MSMVKKGVPILQRAETWLQPNRLSSLTGPIAHIALSIPALIMAIALALPVPLGNVPPIASLVVLSLGLLTRDGVAVLVGYLLSLLAVLWVGMLIFFGAEILERLWAMFGWT